MYGPVRSPGTVESVHETIATSRHSPLVARAEDDAKGAAELMSVGAQISSCFHLPNLDGAIPTTRNCFFSVLAHCYAIYVIAMSSEVAEEVGLNRPWRCVGNIREVTRITNASTGLQHRGIWRQIEYGSELGNEAEPQRVGWRDLCKSAPEVCKMFERKTVRAGRRQTDKLVCQGDSHGQYV